MEGDLGLTEETLKKPALSVEAIQLFYSLNPMTSGANGKQIWYSKRFQSARRRETGIG